LHQTLHVWSALRATSGYAASINPPVSIPADENHN